MISLGMLNNVMRPDKNYKEYRDILRKAAPPCVPFLGASSPPPSLPPFY
jgi:son of sevenless-like protein